MRSEVRGTEIVVDGLEHASNAVRAAAMMGVIEALQVAHVYCADMISEDDHTLKDLAAMGHPYSAAHGFTIHEPDETVHEQSGGYLGALKAQRPSSYADGAIVEGEVGIDPTNAAMTKLDRWIQTGTTKMRARQWAERVAHDHEAEIAQPIVERINAAVRTEGAQ